MESEVPIFIIQNMKQNKKRCISQGHDGLYHFQTCEATWNLGGILLTLPAIDTRQFI